MTAAIRTRGLVHVYRVDGTDVAALRGVDLEVLEGQRVALLGPSGSGKSTLMSIVSAVIRPTVGSVDVLGVPLHTASPRAVHALRRNGLGLLLQGAATNLLPFADALSNVAWAVRGVGRGDFALAEHVLDAYGLARDRRPVGDLPPAEQQVAALAVALGVRPRLLLADEPTSQLGGAARDRLLDVIVAATAAAGAAMLMVTHDHEAAGRLDRTVHLRNGRIAEEVTPRGRFAVLGADGAVQLPASVTDRWPAGSLLAVSESDDVVTIRMAQP